jgi:hypothetical protein
MTVDPEPGRYTIDFSKLPTNFPTHKHAPEFWEALGRAVATFGLLEETLGKAIFSFTATRQVPPDEAEAEHEKWLPTLEEALRDPLGGLIDAYAAAVRSNRKATITNLHDLTSKLREASAMRNVLCHGSWRVPDDEGRSLPLFVTRKMQIFDTPIDTAFLQQVQRHTAELICAVVSSVTHMGWQFPGSNGPGSPIWSPSR